MWAVGQLKPCNWCSHFSAMILNWSFVFLYPGTTEIFIESSCSQVRFYSKAGIYHWIKAKSCWTRDQSERACFSAVCHVALVSSIHRFSLLDCLRLRFAAAVSDKMLLLCLRKQSLLSCAVLVCYQTEKNTTQASNLLDCPVLKHQFTLVQLWSAIYLFFLICLTLVFFKTSTKGMVKPKMKIFSSFTNAP